MATAWIACPYTSTAQAAGPLVCQNLWQLQSNLPGKFSTLYKVTHQLLKRVNMSTAHLDHLGIVHKSRFIAAIDC